MIGRIFGGALAQFSKFRCEDIVHVERFGEILGNIHPTSTPRAQIDFLKDAQIRLMLADLLFNVVQMLAAIDVPIQDSGVSAKSRCRVGVVSRQKRFESLRGRRGNGRCSQSGGKRQEGTAFSDQLPHSSSEPGACTSHAL